MTKCALCFRARFCGLNLSENGVKPLHRLCIAALFLCFVLCFAPQLAVAQSVGFGLGLGVPLMDYFTNNVDREYRITPEPGYYPVLKTLENALGSLHVHADFLLPMDDWGFIDELDFRFDIARMRWKQSRVTHVTCTPIDVVNGSFSDAAAQYVPLKDVSAECLNLDNYDETNDISNAELSSLWFFHISVGARYNFFQVEDWKIFVGLHLGLTLATTITSELWLGGNADALLGAAYRLSPLVWIELNARILFLVTESPDDTQLRINHETQTGGNILTSLIQADAYIDFQLVIRFDFNEL